MKVTTHSEPVPTPPPFQPFDLTFRIETEADLSAMFFLMNYSPICDVLHETVNTSEVRQLLREHAGVADPYKDWEAHMETIENAVQNFGPYRGQKYGLAR